MLTKEEITEWFKELQDSICSALQEEDGKSKFQEDLWERAEGGGGRTRIIQDGNVIEKGGVNFSAVFGDVPDFLKKEVNSEVPLTFYATGVSIVIHPINPFVPIIHMNVRYFEMSNGTWWFGGGIDLTPHYINKEDARFFHKTLKDVCDKNDPKYYEKHKKWADDYFFIPHRNETRGVGGIFFDRLNDGSGKGKEKVFEYVKDVGLAFAPIYTYLMNKNKEIPFSDNHKEWQYVRRGRYVEFNLVYDKGTKFGLETNGRIESILMSLPKTAQWHYNYNALPQSAEAETLRNLKKGINWV